MLEVLQYIFSNIWVFLGTSFLLALIASAVQGLIVIEIKKEK
jgi:hypothetical protein